MTDDEEGGSQPPKRKLIDRIMTVLYLDDSCGATYGSIRNWFSNGSHRCCLGSNKMDLADMVAVSKDPAMLCIEQLSDLSAL